MEMRMRGLRIPILKFLVRIPPYYIYGVMTPNKLKIKMVTPGGEVMYDIPIMKSHQYTIAAKEVA